MLTSPWPSPIKKFLVLIMLRWFKAFRLVEHFTTAIVLPQNERRVILH